MEHAALIYTMVIMSAADSDMTDKELFTIGDIIQTIPAFEDFDPERLCVPLEETGECGVQTGRWEVGGGNEGSAQER